MITKDVHFQCKKFPWFILKMKKGVIDPFYTQKRYLIGLMLLWVPISSFMDFHHLNCIDKHCNYGH